jgi:hypothetical protein
LSGHWRSLPFLPAEQLSNRFKNAPPPFHQLIAQPNRLLKGAD